MNYSYIIDLLYRPARKEEDGVFHAKPVKYKRPTDKQRPVDFDKGQSNIPLMIQEGKSARMSKYILSKIYNMKGRTHCRELN